MGLVGYSWASTGDRNPAASARAKTWKRTAYPLIREGRRYHAAAKKRQTRGGALRPGV
jgi:hypothetical protein